MSGAVVAKPAAAVPAVVHTFADLERMAAAVAKSGLFGVKTQEAALSLMLLAQAEGRHPAIAARDYHIVDGKPSLKADTMLARFQESGGLVEWHELTDAKCAASFTPPGGKPLRIEWTIEAAQRAGLAGKEVWKKYPRAMLRSRVISEAIRTVAPGVIVGTYTPEELADGDAAIENVVAVVKTPGGELVDRETGEVLRPASPAGAEGATDAVIVDERRPEPARPGLDEGARLDHLAAIEAASTLDELKRAHGTAYRAAYELDDISSLKAFDQARNARREALTGGAPAAS